MAANHEYYCVDHHDYDDVVAGYNDDDDDDDDDDNDDDNDNDDNECSL